MPKTAGGRVVNAACRLSTALEERQDSDRPAGDASSLPSRVASGPQHVPRSLSGCQLSRIGVHPVKNCHKGVKMWTQSQAVS
jgi:hypothetical protein